MAELTKTDVDVKEPGEDLSRPSVSPMRNRRVRIIRDIYPVVYRDAVHEFTREYLIAILESTSGNVSKAAKKMQMARRNAQLKIKALGIDIRGIRNSEWDEDEQA